jgi:hypothetical protein
MWSITAVDVVTSAPSKCQSTLCAYTFTTSSVLLLCDHHNRAARIALITPYFLRTAAPRINHRMARTAEPVQVSGNYSISTYLLSGVADPAEAVPIGATKLEVVPGTVSASNCRVLQPTSRNTTVVAGVGSSLSLQLRDGYGNLAAPTPTDAFEVELHYTAVGLRTPGAEAADEAIQIVPLQAADASGQTWTADFEVYAAGSLLASFIHVQQAGAVFETRTNISSLNYQVLSRAWLSALLWLQPSGME